MAETSRAWGLQGLQGLLALPHAAVDLGIKWLPLTRWCIRWTCKRLLHGLHASRKLRLAPMGSSTADPWSSAEAAAALPDPVPDGAPSAKHQ